jgi:hypothetical protein
MKRLLLAILTLSLMLIVVPATSSHAQDEENGNLFYMTMTVVKVGKLGDLLALQEKISTAKDNEYIISQRVFTHMTGPEWSLMTMTEYKDLTARQKANERAGELYTQKFPDEEERAKIGAESAEYVLSHTDAMVVENPKLRK